MQIAILPNESAVAGVALAPPLPYPCINAVKAGNIYKFPSPNPGFEFEFRVLIGQGVVKDLILANFRR